MARPEREAQALREVGRTMVRRSVAILVSVVFLMTIAAMIALDQGVRHGAEVGVFRDLVDGVVSDLAASRENGPIVTNRRVKQGLDRFETDLEESSWLRHAWVPVAQWRLATTLGLGSEQVVVGDGGWLFYRADVLADGPLCHAGRDRLDGSDPPPDA